MGRALGWIGRRLLLYLLLVAAIGFASFALPWIKREIEGERQARQRYEALTIAQATLAAEARAARGRLDQSIATARRGGIAAIDARLAAATREHADIERAVRQSPPLPLLALQGGDAVIAAKRRELALILLDREMAGLGAARALATADAASARTALDSARAEAAARAAVEACDRARAAQSAYEARWRWRVRAWIDNDEHRALAGRTRAACDAARRAAERHRLLVRGGIEAAAARARAEAALAQARAALPARIDGWRAAFDGEVRQARTLWAGNWSERARLWADRLGLRAILVAAGWALAAILVMPYAIRLFLYFVVAPLAIRRPAIRLAVPGGSGAAIALPGRSSTSVAVRLDRGEELLVRQDYLQSSSHPSAHRGARRTRWLLDWRHPLSSLASGLSFLTCLRGDGETTTLSAVRDPFAEVLVLRLPEGAACVLQPRALAAVAQPIGRPLRISSHWRLGSLNAWLTLQLRYLVFHGPARLVLKGGRGVRVERAERGRIFGQDQLVGFSADLAYSVTRTETFWPYLLGREPLLKDRVEAGEGLLIVEEAPLAGRATGHRGAGRHGLEGMIDAMLKLVGL